MESGDHALALAFINKADATPIRGEDKLVKGWISAIQAEVHASLHEETACQIALDRAESQIESGVTNDRYWTGFGASRLTGYRSVCLLRLGKPQRALTLLNASLQQLEPQSERRRARILADMATAHAKLGEVEEACQLAGDALIVARKTRQSAVEPRLQRFRTAVGPWQDHAAVRHFDEQLLLA